MSEKTIHANLVGNPAGGELDDPWPPNRPEVGERVAIFTYEVRDDDGVREDLRTFHITPADRAETGPIDQPTRTPQGVTVQWRGSGTGTVTARDSRGDTLACAVEPDDPTLVA
ncbi:hypothetical protein [Pseudonocardia phyllosphaerae]|uniref:hypothetical protein n=1 Tax=Pseudonocardia phyllosphaerae TaxID=3390502 RepID=UPI00397A1604